MILSTIQCKIIESFPQTGNDETNIYKNILSRQSVVDYSPGIRFETSLVNMDEAKSLTTRNQPEKLN